MKTILVTKDINLSDIEKNIKEISGHPGDFKLRLPNSLRESGGLGIETFLIQLICTWIKNNPNSILHTYANDIDEFENLCDKMYGICALSLCDEIWQSDKEKVKRRDALKAAIPRVLDIRNLDFGNAFKGQYLGLAAIKAMGRSNEFDMPFYTNDELISKNRFLHLSKKALSTILSKQQYKKLDDFFITQLSEIIRELFTNTHKHARQDEVGNYLLKNFRCVIFNNSIITKAKFNIWLKSGGKGKVKFGSHWIEYLNNNRLPILDLSIIDAGPGFACRWLGKNIHEFTPEIEKKAFLNCFKKYSTSETGYSSGTGLTNVLTSIRDLNGMFRLSTGRIVLEKSFISKDESVEINETDLDVKALPSEGTAYNFIIPLVSR